MRYSIEREVEFDAGHRVPWHGSKCRNPHGHRYRVQAEISGPLVDAEGTSEHGMVADFGRLKELLMFRVHDRFDHGFIVHEDDYAMRRALQMGQGDDGVEWNVVRVGFVPTAENLAAAIFADLLRPVADLGRGVQLDRVTVWETPTCKATVTR